MASETENKYLIHEAAREGRLSQVETLLSANSKLSQQRDLDDRLPQHWAAAHNQLDMVKLLSTTRGFDADAQDGSGWTALMMAASLKDDAGLGVIEALLAKEADATMQAGSGGTALHFAVSKGNLEVVRRLMRAGASARVKDRRGQMPLHRAAAGGSVPIVRVLLGPEGKAPVNATDVDGCTPLHHAVSEGHGDVAVELLKAGADTDKKDTDGRLAIDCAPDAKVRGYIVKAAEREGIDLE